MLSRTDFLNVKKRLISINIYELGELYPLADSFITYVNAIDNNKETDVRIDLIRKAQYKANEMLQLLISKVNPDLNILIEFHNEQNNSYKLLTDCLGIIQGEIEKDKKQLIHDLSNKEYINSNKITNKITIDYYSSNLRELVNGIVLNPIKEALIKYVMLDEPATKDILRYAGKIIKIEKNKNLFWFLVFCYMLRSSQFIGYLGREDQKIKRQIDVIPLKKLIRNEIQLDKQTPKDSEDTETEDNEEEQEESDDEDSEEDEEIPYHKEIISPEILSFQPKINGQEELLEEEEDEE